MPSFAARLAVVGLRLAGTKRRLFAPAQFRKPDRDRGSGVPSAVRRRVEVTEATFEGWPVTTLAPSGSTGDRILYLHGGAYAAGPRGLHWAFAARLATATARTVVVPRYPLTPENTHRDVFPTLLALYRDLATADLATADRAPRVAIAGDSAGGGMALALAQALAETDEAGSRADVVLFCPWLDATLANPGVADVDPRDPMLCPDHLRLIGTWYAGGDAPTHPRVSPLNGTFAGLGRVVVFGGTRDVLHPDANLLRTAAAKAGTMIEVHEYPGMIHDWMLLPIPEARDVLARVAAHLA